MLRFLRILIILVVALILLGFAFANRQLVTVSFDPFAARESAAFSLDAPLFAVAIVSAMLGVVAGACATWLSQGRHRRASRRHRVEAEKWRAQAETLKAGRAAVESARPALPRNG
jgi:uncharacterized integral membrane protein